MIITQLSVFLENKPGRLAAAADVLAQSGVDISALTLADTAEFGILRLIVNDPALAKKALTEAGIVVRLTDVIAVAMDDVPGGTVGALRLLSEKGINVEYMYACVGRVSGKALMVMRTDDTDRADAAFREAGFDQIPAGDVYRI